MGTNKFFVPLIGCKKPAWVAAICFGLVPLLPDVLAPFLMPLPLLFALFDKDARSRMASFFKPKNALLLWLVAFCVTGLLGVLWSGAKSASLLTALLWVVCLAGCLGVGASISTKRDLVLCLLGMGAGATLSSLLAIGQLVAFQTGVGLPNPLWVPLEQALIELLPGIDVNLEFTAKRACAGFTNSGVYGFYLVTVIPAASLFALRTKGWQRLVAFACLLICAVGLFGCYSRMSYITFFVVVAVVVAGVAILRYQRQKERHPAAKWWLLGSIVAIPAVLVLLLIFLPQSVTQRFFSAFSQDNSIRTRWALWTASGTQFLKEPLAILFGYGTGVQPVWEMYNKVSWLKLMGIQQPHAHNLYLQLLLEGGLLRLLPFAGCVAAFFARVLRHRKGQLPAQKLTLFLLACCLVALLLNGLTDYTFVDPKLCFLFMALMGLGLALPQIYPAKKEKEGQHVSL